MIPVLFPSNATTFTSNGLGRLSDAISCTVEEERNGKYELEMEFPVDGIHFDLLAHSRIILAKPADGEDPQPFEIYEIGKPINGKCTIRAEHISYRLSRIPVMPFGQQTAVAQALQGLKTNAAESCPFTFWTDKTSAGTFEVKEPKSIRACLGGESGSILQAFGGGEYMWDGFTVKLYQQRGADNGVVIRYGKNITDLTQDESIAETITGVCPYWHGTDSSENEVIVTLPEKVLHSTNAENYPYNRTAVLDCSSAFQAIPTVSQLRAYAQNYMATNNIGVPKVSIKIKFVPLWQSEEYKGKASIERVKLCDTVTVRFEKLGVDATAKVIRTKYNVLAERYDEIELGDAKSSMVKSVKADVASAVESVEETQSLLRRNVVSAINQILAGQNGDIIFTIDETTGKRTNIMAMDTSDPTTANKILMINYEGIGGFSNGLNDQSGYTLAITRDGKVNAEAINTGTLLAALMLGNVLKLGGNGLGANGTLEVYNSSNQRIGKWDKNGIDAEGDLKITGTYTRKYFEGSERVRTELRSGTNIPNGGQSADGDGFIEAFYGNNLNPDRISTYDGQACYFSRTCEPYSGTEDIAGNNACETVRTTANYIKNIEIIVPESEYSDIDGDGELEWIGVDPNVGEVRKYVFTVSAQEISLSNNCFPYNNGNVPNVTDFLPEISMKPEEFRLKQHSGDSHYFIWLRDGDNINNRFDDISLKAGKATLEITYDNRNDVIDTAEICGAEVQFTSSSSRRYKHSIKPLDDAELDPHRLLKLTPVQFEYNADHITQYADMHGKIIPGLIAEDVDEVYPSATIHGKNGEVESWDERRIIPGMLALIQEQAKRIEELEKRIEALEKKA